MTTDITALFVGVMDIAVMYLHNSAGRILILEIVTDQYVYLTNAGEGLII